MLATASSALLVLAAGAMAQGTPTRFEAPDGTPFVLVADPSVPQLHWAIASSLDAANEPLGLEGLAWATLHASLHGTWHTGSVDAGRERAAMSRLDAAWQRMLRGEANANDDVRRCDEEARALADLTVFPRVLAAAPVHRPELLARGAAGILVLTTLPAAVGEVGRLLVERREDQALRELPRAWLLAYAERVMRQALDPLRPMHAEVLALSMPDHPANRAFDVPATASPSREQAFAVWNSTQRPERTVHVLLGDFDVPSVKAVLEATFARTALPAAAPRPENATRPLAGVRRSSVNGIAVPTLAMAWMLPPDADRFVLATAVRWLAGGPDSRLARELQRQGRTTTAVSGTAPWPATCDGRCLLLVEASDKAGVTGLADAMLDACRAAAGKPPEADTMADVTASLQREWQLTNGEPRLLAADLAAAALRWPRQEPATHWPERIELQAVQDLLARTFAGHPVIVEGKQ